MSKEIEAEKLVPLVLHFAKEYLHKKDYKKLVKHMGEVDVDNDELVKKVGGIRGLLECYFKHNSKDKKKAAPKKREVKSKRKDGVVTRSRSQSLDW